MAVVWTPGPDVLLDAQVVLVLPLALAIHCNKSHLDQHRYRVFQCTQPQCWFQPNAWGGSRKDHPPRQPYRLLCSCPLGTCPR
jgi:hypothetical protein